MDEILNSIMGRIPRVDNPFASRRWKQFSAADWHANEMERAGLVEWKEWKDKGNALFKEKDYAGARAMYRKAYSLAFDPFRNGGINGFFDALNAWPAHTAHRQFFDIEPLVGQVFKFLPRTFSRVSPIDRKTYAAPNNGAAVCAANMSAAWLLDGRPKEALRAAKKATKADPSYLKAHRRELNALQALQRSQPKRVPDRKLFEQYSKAIQEKRDELADYEQARAAYPTEALSLLTAGWLDYERAACIYGPVRFMACLEALTSPDGPLAAFKKCEARASLVPFQGGQVLMLSLCHTHANGMDNVINCLDWIMVDEANGDLADKPPQGVASEKSLHYAPMRINMYVEELTERGLEVVSVMLGQGLTDQVDLIDKTLREGSSIMQVKTFDDILVYHAASTAASEDNGVPMNPDPRSFDALMRRRPPRQLDARTGLDYSTLD